VKAGHLAQTCTDICILAGILVKKEDDVLFPVVATGTG
jgi:hypothetical protein